MAEDLLSAEECQAYVEAMIALYPQSDSDLDYHNHFELLCAVMLSAQTTDKAVNKVTPALFKAYPTPEDMQKASPEAIADKIKTIGLYRNKAKFLQATAESLVNDFSGQVPDNLTDLTSLPGVGRKTANVVLGVGFSQASFPVDTHIARVTKRFNMVPESANPNKIEKIMTEKLPENMWRQAHLSILHFGRYQCVARKHDHQECLDRLHAVMAKQQEN
ncbi:endonuclease III [Aerococcus kribbianus]|uniref:Endonuclease III n=1 Tax=Aerococcus kribbianus TaxID=2999064 RepID=A0A9X3FP66_9LACT|nr:MULTISPECIES: endonuclease III [unclassified Aerococcus]MCZ0717398.1 endonuclease III [Aerococcus sp. YH-aer221]MCZ0725686.1 endonuclease III [Aerococcus sp. YH-aer222]